MPETLRISLTRGVSALRVIDASGGEGVSPLRGAGNSAETQGQGALATGSEQAQMEQQGKDLAQLCETVGNLAGKLDRLYQQTVAHSHGEIAKLAVEIARKIVMCEIAKGGYDIQAIIEEALKRVPTHQDLVVRVNPQDAPSCQRLQGERPDSEFAKLQFVGDWSIARANCLIETPKGIVRSFAEEGLERIREALEKSQ